MLNALITGSNGLLGSAFKKNEFFDNNLNFTFHSKEVVDITDLISLNKYFVKNKHDIILNCAAFTDVDASEKDIDNLNKINIQGLNNLLSLSAEYNFKLVNFSSDYVFDGNKTVPYSEEDNPNPLSSYGNSKFISDKILQQSNKKSIIIRTSWLYGDHYKSFTNKIIKLSKSKKSINVIDDQIGSPTYVDDLVYASIKILKNEKKWNGDIYNFCNKGSLSWYQFALKLQNRLNLDLQINPIKTIEFNQMAERPKFSVLSCEKIANNFNIFPRTFEESFNSYLNNIIK